MNPKIVSISANELLHRNRINQAIMTRYDCVNRDELFRFLQFCDATRGRVTQPPLLSHFVYYAILIESRVFLLAPVLE